MTSGAPTHARQPRGAIGAARVWLVLLAAFVAGLWLLQSVLLPFVLAMVIAYVLDPVVDRLERNRIGRTLGAISALLLFVLAVVGTFMLLVPLFQVQVVSFLEVLPALAERARAEFRSLLAMLGERLRPQDLERLQAAATGYAGDAVGFLGALVGRVLSGGVALFDVLSVALVTPIVAFYLLRDWNRIIETIDGWLPRSHADTIREQACAIDRTLAAFLRGQASVCLILGGFYAVALTVVGLDFGFAVGVVSGVLTIVPYVGSAVGFLCALSLAMVQFEGWVMPAVVAGIFLFGQAAEGNVITPRLVGGSVGLHPVWVMFALFAGAALFGFLGVLVAVPVAAVIGVLVRFALRQYLASAMYTGVEPQPCPTAAPTAPPDTPATAPPDGTGAASGDRADDPDIAVRSRP